MLRRAVTSNARALCSPTRFAANAPSLATLKVTRAPTRSPSLILRAAQPSLRRWYSAESEAPKTDGAKAEAKDGSEEADPLAEAKKQLEAKDKEIIDLKDRYLRSVADFRNLQDRTTRDMKSARDFAIQKFAKDLVDSVDNLDRALSTVPEATLKDPAASKDLVSLHDGLRMTEGILMQTLLKHGLERFSPEGEKFNANEHEATFMSPQPGKDDGTVFYVEQKGFKLNGRILRAAKVGIVKNK